ncbi:MAG: hypothetical protein IJS29_10660 [Selenomonadaceae bacterium]|nr:hypothetical protein [Selenomonadaceae bacterium]
MSAAEDSIKFTGNEESLTFSVDELKILATEIKDMIIEGKEIDLDKAVHNARYFAEIDRRIADIKAGNYVEHELIEVQNA